MLQNLGQPNLDYDAFKLSFDKNPEQYKNLIKKFDGKGITIKTDAEDKPVGGTTNDKKSSLDSSAKRAAANVLKK